MLQLSIFRHLIGFSLSFFHCAATALPRSSNYSMCKQQILGLILLQWLSPPFSPHHIPPHCCLSVAVCLCAGMDANLDGGIWLQTQPVLLEELFWDRGEETSQKICFVGWIKALGQQLDHAGLCLTVKWVRHGVPVPVSLIISVFCLATIQCKKTPGFLSSPGVLKPGWECCYISWMYWSDAYLGLLGISE